MKNILILAVTIMLTGISSNSYAAKHGKNTTGVHYPEDWKELYGQNYRREVGTLSEEAKLKIRIIGFSEDPANRQRRVEEQAYEQSDLYLQHQRECIVEVENMYAAREDTSSGISSIARIAGYGDIATVIDAGATVGDVLNTLSGEEQETYNSCMTSRKRASESGVQ